MKQRTFFKKLLITYLSIIIFYTLLAVLIFFLITLNSTGKQWATQNKIYIDQVSSTIENNLKLSIGIVQQLQGNADIISFVTQDEIDYYNLSQNYNHLRKYQTPFNNLGLFLGIGKRLSDQIISHEGTIDRDRFYKEMNFDVSDRVTINNYMTNFSKTDYVILNSNSSYYGTKRDYITLIKRQKFSKNNEMIAYMSFMEKKLIPELNKEQEGVLLILNKEKVFSKRESGVTLDKIDIEDLWTGSVEGFELYSVESKVLDWKYVYLVPNNIVDKQRVLLIFQSAFAYLLLTMIGGLVAFLVTKKTYSPMYKIMKYFKQDSTQNITNEFEIIERVSLGMIQSNDNLKQIIKNDNISLRNKLLRDLLYGLVNGDKLEERLLKHRLNTEREELCSIILEYEDFTTLQQSYSEESFLAIRKQIITIITQAMSDIEDYEIVELDFKRIVLIVGKNKIEDVLEVLEVVLFNIERDHNIKISGAVGHFVKSIEYISKSFSDALNFLEYRALIPNIRLIRESDITKDKKVKYYYPFEMEQNLINYVLKGKSEETVLLLNHLIEKNFDNNTSFIENQAMFSFAIVGTINRLLNQMNKNVLDVFQEDFEIYLELKKIQNISGYKDRLLKMFDILIKKSIDNIDYNDENRLAVRILEFIQKNYMIDLSLLDIAEEFSITPAYVSMLFKKEHQLNFKDYLNQFRIKEAKDIIKSNPHIKNAEIASRIGFNSVNTFIRIFKKYEGISPGRYIELHNDINK